MSEMSLVIPSQWGLLEEMRASLRTQLAGVDREVLDATVMAASRWNVPIETIHSPLWLLAA